VNGKAVSAKVTIYLGTIKDNINSAKNDAEFKGNTDICQQKEYMMKELARNGDIDALIGANGVHESIHSSNKENKKQNYENIVNKKHYDIEESACKAQFDYINDLNLKKEIKSIPAKVSIDY
jgi:hypothetical protein